MDARERELFGAVAMSLDALDLLLTGRVSPNIRPAPLDPYDWLKSELYLSDGGYSRVVYRPSDDSFVTYRLVLTDNSRDAVRAAWDRATNERATIEAAFRALFD